MDGYTIVLCTSGEIVDCEFGVCYNRPSEKGVSINNMITFDELETKLNCYLIYLNVYNIIIKIIIVYCYFLKRKER